MALARLSVLPLQKSTPILRASPATCPDGWRFAWNGLVTAFVFDSAGTPRDLVVSGRTAIIGSTATLGASALGRALVTTTDTNSYAHFRTVTPGSNRSIMALFRLPSLPGSSAFVVGLTNESTANAPSAYLHILSVNSNGSLDYYEYNGGTGTLSTAAGFIEANKTYAVIGVSDNVASQQRLYVNGVEVGTRSMASFTQACDGVSVNAAPAGWARSAMQVGAIAFWNRALSAGEAARLSGSPLAPFQSGYPRLIGVAPTVTTYTISMSVAAVTVSTSTVTKSVTVDALKDGFSVHMGGGVRIGRRMGPFRAAFAPPFSGPVPRSREWSPLWKDLVVGFRAAPKSTPKVVGSYSITSVNKGSSVAASGAAMGGTLGVVATTAGYINLNIGSQTGLQSYNYSVNNSVLCVFRMPALPSSGTTFVAGLSNASNTSVSSATLYTTVIGVASTGALTLHAVNLSGTVVSLSTATGFIVAGKEYAVVGTTNNTTAEMALFCNGVKVATSTQSGFTLPATSGTLDSVSMGLTTTSHATRTAYSVGAVAYWKRTLGDVEAMRVTGVPFGLFSGTARSVKYKYAIGAYQSTTSSMAAALVQATAVPKTVAMAAAPIQALQQSATFGATSVLNIGTTYQGPWRGRRIHPISVGMRAKPRVSPLTASLVPVGRRNMWSQLVNCWLLNEGAGTPKDLVAHTDTTITSGAWTKSPEGHAIAFTNGRLNVTATDTPGAYSVAFRYATTVNTTNYLFESGRLRVYDGGSGTLSFWPQRSGTSPAWSVTGATVPLNTWQTVVITYNPTLAVSATLADRQKAVRFYRSPSQPPLYHSSSLSTPTGTENSGAGSATVGASTGSTSNTKIAWAALWNRELGSGEARAILADPYAMFRSQPPRAYASITVNPVTGITNAVTATAVLSARTLPVRVDSNIGTSTTTVTRQGFGLRPRARMAGMRKTEGGSIAVIASQALPHMRSIWRGLLWAGMPGGSKQKDIFGNGPTRMGSVGAPTGKNAAGSAWEIASAGAYGVYYQGPPLHRVQNMLATDFTVMIQIAAASSTTWTSSGYDLFNFNFWDDTGYSKYIYASTNTDGSVDFEFPNGISTTTTYNLQGEESVPVLASDNKVHTYLFVRRGGTLRAYRDGQIASASVSTVTGALQAATQRGHVVLGSFEHDQPTFGWSPPSTINMAAMWTRALDTSEIVALGNSPTALLETTSGRILQGIDSYPRNIALNADAKLIPEIVVTTYTKTATVNAFLNVPVVMSPVTYGALLRKTVEKTLVPSVLLTGSPKGVLRRPRFPALTVRPLNRDILQTKMAPEWKWAFRGMALGAMLGGDARKDVFSHSDAVLMGSSSWTGVSRLGRVVSIPGSTSDGLYFTRTPKMTPLGTEITIAVWANITAISENSSLVGIPYTSSTSIYMEPYDLISFSRNGTTYQAYFGYATSSGQRVSVTSNEYYFDNQAAGFRLYAVTRSGANVKFYRGAQQYGTSQILTTNSAPDSTNTLDVSVFNRSRYYPGDATTGQVGAVYVWNRALGPQEIRRLAQDPYGPFRIASRASVVFRLGGYDSINKGFALQAALKKSALTKSALIQGALQRKTILNTVALTGTTLAATGTTESISATGQVALRAPESVTIGGLISKAYSNAVAASGSVIKQGATKAISVGAYLFLRFTPSVTATGVLKKISVRSLVSVGALLEKARAKGVGMTAVIKAFADTVTTDINARVVVRGVPAVDATASLIRGSVAKTVQIGAALKKTGVAILTTVGASILPPMKVTVGAVLNKTGVYAVSVAGHLYARFSQGVIFNSVLKVPQRLTVAASALLEKGRSKTVEVTATIKRAGATKAVTASARIVISGANTIGTAAVLLRRRAVNTLGLAGSLIKYGATKTVQLSGELGPPLLFRANAVLLKSRTVAMSVGAVIKTRILASATANAMLRATEPLSVGVSTLLEKARSKTLGVTASLRKAGVTGSTTVGARIILRVSSNVQMAAMLSKITLTKAVNMSVVIRKQVNKGVAMAAVFTPPMLVRANGVLAKSLDRTVSASAVIMKRASAVLSASGVTKRARILGVTANALLEKARSRTIEVTGSILASGKTVFTSVAARVVLKANITTSATAVLSRAKATLNVVMTAAIRRTGLNKTVQLSGYMSPPLLFRASGVLLKNLSAGVGATAMIRKTTALSLGIAGTLKRQVRTATVSLAALLEKAGAKTVAVAGVLKALDPYAAVSVAGRLVLRTTTNVVLEAALRVRETAFTVVNTVIQRRNRTSNVAVNTVLGPPLLFRANALLKQTYVGTLAVGAMLYLRATQALDVSGVVKAARRLSIAGDVLLEKARSKTIGATATLKRIGATATVALGARVIFKQAAIVGAQAVLRGATRLTTAVSARLQQIYLPVKMNAHLRGVLGQIVGMGAMLKAFRVSKAVTVTARVVDRVTASIQANAKITQPTTITTAASAFLVNVVARSVTVTAHLRQTRTVSVAVGAKLVLRIRNTVVANAALVRRKIADTVTFGALLWGTARKYVGIQGAIKRQGASASTTANGVIRRTIGSGVQVSGYVTSRVNSAMQVGASLVNVFARSVQASAVVRGAASTSVQVVGFVRGKSIQAVTLGAVLYRKVARAIGVSTVAKKEGATKGVQVSGYVPVQENVSLAVAAVVRKSVAGVLGASAALIKPLLRRLTLSARLEPAGTIQSEPLNVEFGALVPALSTVLGATISDGPSVSVADTATPALEITVLGPVQST